jgi:hypothetical protein
MPLVTDLRFNGQVHEHPVHTKQVAIDFGFLWLVGMAEPGMIGRMH